MDDAGRVHEFATVPSSGVFQGKADDTAWQYDAETGKPSWHTDQSFRSPRPLASAMYCLETPGDGVGQTVFCSTVAACEDLPARVRTRLEKLRAAHSYEQLSSSFQRFAGGTAKTLSRSHEPALYHLVEDGALYLAPHAISHVVDETGKELAKGSRARRAPCVEYVLAAGWRTRAPARGSNFTSTRTLPRHRRDDGSWSRSMSTCGVEQSANDACGHWRTRVRGEAAHVAHDGAAARRRC